VLATLLASLGILALACSWFVILRLYSPLELFFTQKGAIERDEGSEVGMCARGAAPYETARPSRNT
jgi:hypothetical protein